MANPVYVNEGHNSGNTGGASNLAITLPATPNEGDVMVAGLYTSATRTVNTLSGWTPLTSEMAGDKVLQTFVREAGPAESTVKTWAFSSSYANPYGGTIAWFSGADDPVTNAPDTIDGNGTTSGTLTVPALTVTEDESVAISFASPSDNHSVTGYPAGETTIFNISGANGMAAGYRNANAGSLGAAVYTTSGSNPWTAARIALAPAPGGGGGPAFSGILGGGVGSGSYLIGA